MIYIFYIALYLGVPHILHIPFEAFWGSFLYEKHMQVILLSLPLLLFPSPKKKTLSFILYTFLTFFTLYIIGVLAFGLPHDVSIEWKKSMNLFLFQISWLFCIFCIHWIWNNPPFSFELPIKKHLTKKEKTFYFLVFLAFLCMHTIIKILFALHISPDTDEMYTYLVIQGWNTFGTINITPSGAPYHQTTLFHYASIACYNFFHSLGIDSLLSLRSFNILYSSLLGIPWYLICIRILGWKLGTWTWIFTTYNRYITLLSIVARSYVTFIYFFVFSVALLLYGIQMLQKHLWKGVILCILSFILWIYNFFEWHILGFYHYIFFLSIMIGYLFFKGMIEQKNTWKLFMLIGIIGISILGIYLYISFYKPSYLIFIQQTIKPILSMDTFLDTGNYLSPIKYLGIGVYILSMYVLYKIGNPFWKILLITISGIILFQTYFFSERMWFSRYLANIVLILLSLVTLFLVYVYRNALMLWIYFITLITLNNVFWYHTILKDTISWNGTYAEQQKENYLYCKKHGYPFIVTDNPSAAYFYGYKESEIYSLRSKKDMYHTLKNGSYEYLYLPVRALDNINDFLYLLYKHKKACFVFSHNAYNTNHHFWNTAFFEYVLTHGKKIKEDILIQETHHLWYFTKQNNYNGTIIVFWH